MDAFLCIMGNNETWSYLYIALSWQLLAYGAATKWSAPCSGILSIR